VTGGVKLPRSVKLPRRRAGLAIFLSLGFAGAMPIFAIAGAIACHDTECPPLSLAFRVEFLVLTLIVGLASIAGGVLILLRKRFGLYILVACLSWNEVMCALTFSNGLYDSFPFTAIFMALVGYLLYQFFTAIKKPTIHMTP